MGPIRLTVSQGASASRLTELEKSLRGWPEIKLLMVGGSVKDIQMLVSAPEPAELANKLKGLPVVEKLVHKGGDIQLKLRDGPHSS